MEKRKFYNTGDAKGFTKQKFFEAVVDMCNGEDVDVDLVRAAAEYELEGIEMRASNKATGEKKDARHGRGQGQEQPQGYPLGRSLGVPCSER